MKEGVVAWTSSHSSLSARVKNKKQKEINMKQMKKTVVLGAAAIGLSVCQSNATLFSTVATGTSEGNTYYVVTSDSVISWEAAEAYAVTMGGTLASITDSAQNSAVYGLIAGSVGTSATVWFGGMKSENDHGNTSDWSWKNGASWSYAPWATGAGQPNVAEGLPDYTVFWAGGGSQWGDAGNSWALNAGNAHSFVVEAVPEPTTMVAGAMLLLPFGMSTLRMLRKSRAA